ncbi:MAG: Crp/Fnr family transcriptional regulator [Dehalococcoidales bacterium]|nr:Crp/Fnr family transcriptional regulator [Dehalococcoidales bacterium]
MAVDSALLKDVPYLSELTAQAQEAVKPLFFERSLRRSELAFMEGEPADALYVLMNGVVKVFKTSSNGKEQIISISTPHEVLNDTSIFGGGPNPVSAQAMSPVVLYGIKKDKLEELLRQHPQMSLSIIKLLSERSLKLLSLIEDLSFKHVIGRVGKILLEHTADGGAKQRLTQQEMAAIAGTAREVVARSLKTLEERGVVKIDRHRILITDKSALEEIIMEST